MTYDFCYDCETKENLVLTEGNDSRPYPICKPCLKKRDDKNE